MANSTEVTELIIRGKNLSAEAFSAIANDLNAAKANAAATSREISRLGGDGTSSIKNMAGAATQLAGAFGVAFSVGAVVQFGKSVFDSASQIHDLAEKMGVSTDAVQGFKFAAEQSGSSLETVSTALTKMNANLAEGDKSTVKALKDAGLSFAQIRNMSPEDAFLAITDAIQKIPDPMVQSDVALKLFGKSAGELLPAIKEGFRGAAAGAAKMSEDTIKSLEAAQDAWDRLGTRVTIVSGNIIAATMDATSKITKSWSDFAMFAQNAIQFGAGAATAMAATQAEAERGGKAAKDIYLGTAGAVRKTKEELDAAAQAAKQHARAVAEVADKYGGMQKKIGEIADAMKRMRPDADWKGLAEDLAKLQKEGARLTPEMIDLAIKFGALGPSAKVGAEGVADLGFQLDLAVPSAVAIGQAIDALNAKIKVGSEGLGDLGFKVSDGFKEGAKAIESLQKQMLSFGSEIARAFQSGGGFLQGLKNLGTSMAKDFTSTVLSFIPGIGPLLSQLGGPIVDGIKKLFGGLFNGNAGRDVVKQWISENFGTSSELQRQLLALGPEYDRLWRGVTQLNKNSSVQEARAAIDAVTAALDAQKRKVAENAAETEAAAKKIDAAQQAAIDGAKARVQALDDEIKSLQDSVASEAPEEEIGIVERITREKIASLQEQRKEAVNELNTLTEQMTDSMDRVADAIERLPDEIAIKLRVDGNWPGGGGYVPMPDSGRYDGLPSSASFASGIAAASARPVQLVITGRGRQVLAQTVLEEQPGVLGAYGAARRS